MNKRNKMFERKISVYVAEDDPLSGKMMTITLNRIGFDFVGLGTNTDICIKEVGELQPDVVLMDIDMPGVTDGIGAADIITKKHNIPVIFVTANSEDSVFERALKTAPFGYVLKPVTRDILHTVIYMGYSRHLLELEVQKKQKQLSELNEQLEEKIKDRTKEIEEKNKQLQTALQKEKEMNEFKSHIVTTISHEFRTPMTTIMSSADIMEMLLKKDKPKEKVFRHTNLIKTSVQELLVLLNDVLITEKMDAGKYEIKKESFSLDEYFEQLLFKIKIGIGKSHHIIAQIDDHLGNIETDKKLFSQITNNFLSNAFKYSEQNSDVHITARIDDDKLFFSVKDHGIGMDEQTLQMIFDSFYRAKNVTNIEGTGMGLSILKKAVDLLGGKINANSTKGEGSEFMVLIPLQ